MQSQSRPERTVMDLTLITDIRKITLTSFDYNIIRSISKDTILLQVAGDLTKPSNQLPALPEKGVVLTDSDQGIRLWTQKKYPVIAYSHKKNTQEELTGTPWLILSLTALSEDYLTEVWFRFHKIPLQILRTQRCYLRELSMKDLPELISLDADQTPDSPGRFFKGNPGSEEEYLSSYIRYQYPFFGYGLYGVYQKETGEFLGIAGFYLPDENHGKENDQNDGWLKILFGEGSFDTQGDDYLEIGYAVKKSVRLKGYAKEWIRALIDHAQDTLHMNHIIARIPAKNKASVKAALSAGGTLLVL